MVLVGDREGAKDFIFLGCLGKTDMHMYKACRLNGLKGTWNGVAGLLLASKWIPFVDPLPAIPGNMYDP